MWLSTHYTLREVAERSHEGVGGHEVGQVLMIAGEVRGEFQLLPHLQAPAQLADGICVEDDAMTVLYQLVTPTQLRVAHEGHLPGLKALHAHGDCTRETSKQTSKQRARVKNNKMRPETAKQNEGTVNNEEQ